MKKKMWALFIFFIEKCKNKEVIFKPHGGAIRPHTTQTLTKANHIHLEQN